MFFLNGSLADLADFPLLQGLMVALGTLVLEDATTITSGLLVAEKLMTPMTAFFGLLVGIVGGDVGLYMIGYVLSDQIVSRRWISQSQFNRSQRWLGGNLFKAVLCSRFIPGARLPMYMAAGALKVSLFRFAFFAICATLCWVIPLLFLTIKLGDAVADTLGWLKWPVAILFIVSLVATNLFFAKKMKEEDEAEDEEAPTGPVTSFFEFWPPWLFYIPVAFFYLKQAIRYGSLSLPTCANPSIYSGGLVKESKSQILSLLPEPYGKYLPRHATYSKGRSSGIDNAVQEVEALLARYNISYPFVAKPDIGHRGAGVRLVNDRQVLSDYLKDYPANTLLLLQELVVYTEEAGIFYVRHPGSPKGRIISITRKTFPHVIGDGERTLKQLIEGDPRASVVKKVYFKRNHDHLDRIIAKDEKFPLVFAGNHCQGAVFTNGAGLLTEELSNRIDEISRAMPEFYFGRFDLRFLDEESLKQGRDFKIVEINGASAEATHIWDAKISLREAYRVLFDQFSILFEISHLNRNRGCRPIGTSQLIRDFRYVNDTFKLYPPAS